MKNIVLTAVAAIALATPLAAQTQLEASLGVEPGVYTLAELAEIKAKSTLTSNDGAVHFGDDLATRGFGNGIAGDFADAHAAESDDSGERGRAFGVNSDVNGEVAAKVRMIVDETITANF